MDRKFFDDLYVNSELWLVAHRYKKYIHKGVKNIKKTKEMKRVFKEKIVPYWKKYGVKVSLEPQMFYSFGDPERFDPRYLPHEVWVRKVVPYFNSLLYAPGFQDKCLHNLFFPDMNRPETVVKNVNGVYYDDQLHLLTLEQAIDRMQAVDRFIVKPSVGSSQGRGIRFYNGSEMSREELAAIAKEYRGKNFVIQKLVKQHAGMAALNESSLNTLRVVSFLYKDEVHILSTVVRIGGAGSLVDNVAAGGYQCDVQPDGRLVEYAYTKRGGKRVFTDVDQKGMRFGDMAIPSYEKIIETVKREASRMGHYRLIGWDIAVDEAGEPVFIEYNCNPGQNQMTSGPTLGDLTEEVLDEVYSRKEG